MGFWLKGIGGFSIHTCLTFYSTLFISLIRSLRTTPRPPQNLYNRRGHESDHWKMQPIVEQDHHLTIHPNNYPESGRNQQFKPQQTSVLTAVMQALLKSEDENHRINPLEVNIEIGKDPAIQGNEDFGLVHENFCRTLSEKFLDCEIILYWTQNTAQ